MSEPATPILGADLIDFSQVNRAYDDARSSFSIDIPESFNFAYDVVDVRARQANKEALIWVDTASGTTTRISYADLADRSAQIAKALMALGIQRGDAASVSYTHLTLPTNREV